jgi:hypothetical protein
MDNKILLAIIAILVIIIVAFVLIFISNKKEAEVIFGPTGNPQNESTQPTVSEPEENLSEQPNKAKFNEYFTNAWIGKLSEGEEFNPMKVVKTKILLTTDQICTSLDTKKTIAAGQLSTAFYDTNTKEYVRPKSVFPQKLSKGQHNGMPGCRLSSRQIRTKDLH